MLKKNCFTIFILFIVCISTSARILYKVSGRVIYNGIGQKGIKIRCLKMSDNFFKEIISDFNGNFFIYLSKGTYQLEISEGNGYVSKDFFKSITVSDKNVANVLFFLEKECKVSGHVKFEDNTPIKDAQVYITNDRGTSTDESDIYGNYLVSGIRAGSNTIIKVEALGICASSKEINITKEGTFLEDINFIFKKNISVIGKIIDKETKNPIKEVFITVLNEKGEFIRALSDDKGEFMFHNFIEGLHGFIFFNPIYKFYIKEFEFKKNEQKEILIELEKKE